MHHQRTMAHPFFLLTLQFFLLFLSLPNPSLSQQCLSHILPKNRAFDQCADLPQLDSFLHWTFDSSESLLDIAFVASPVTPAGWISWAINPSGQGMIGAQALIAFKTPDDGQMTVETFNITGYSNIRPSPISLEVSSLDADFRDEKMIIFAKFRVPVGWTSINHLWQVGGSVVDSIPTAHPFDPQNLGAVGRLDLVSGKSQFNGAEGASRARKKNIHGILSSVSWGILFAMGAMIARYTKAVDPESPAWFYFHMACQVAAYAIGTAGFATGIQLGNQSPGVVYTVHRTVGIIVFCICTLQMSALLFRPQKEHKYRIYWTWSHRLMGLAVIILGVYNVFKGLDILNPEKLWRKTYIFALVAMAVALLLLETVTQILACLKRKPQDPTP